MKATNYIEKNTSTEEKIKEAAKRVFTIKGFAATRTRDIAVEAGFNIALINYYFRSKQKLFEIIMIENMQLFIHNIIDIVNDNTLQFEEKIENVVSHYIDMLIKNPDLPLFVLSELRANPQEFASKVGISEIPLAPGLIRQWQEFASTHQLAKINPIHFAVNLISLTIFPFIASPLIRNRSGMNIDQFNMLMEERKKLIPKWVLGMMLSSNNLIE